MGKYFKVLLCLMIVSLVLTGCGRQLGEENAENVIKDNLRIKDSYKKVSYEVNESAGVSKFTYKAKNAMNAELEGIVYFEVKKDGKVKVLGDENIIGIDTIYKERPEKLAEFVVNYAIFNDVLKNNCTTITMFLEHAESVGKDGRLNDNYFAWQELKYDSKKYNVAVNKVHHAWENLKASATEKVITKIMSSQAFEIYDGITCTGMSPIQVNLEGGFGEWRASAKFVDYDTPGTENK